MARMKTICEVEMDGLREEVARAENKEHIWKTKWAIVSNDLDVMRGTTKSLREELARVENELDKALDQKKIALGTLENVFMHLVVRLAGRPDLYSDDELESIEEAIVKAGGTPFKRERRTWLTEHKVRFDSIERLK